IPTLPNPNKRAVAKMRPLFLERSPTHSKELCRKSNQLLSARHLRQFPDILSTSSIIQYFGLHARYDLISARPQRRTEWLLAPLSSPQSNWQQKTKSTSPTK